MLFLKIRKQIKDRNRHFTEEDVQMANGHTRICTALLAIRETQIQSMEHPPKQLSQDQAWMCGLVGEAGECLPGRHLTSEFDLKHLVNQCTGRQRQKGQEFKASLARDPIRTDTSDQPDSAGEGENGTGMLRKQLYSGKTRLLLKKLSMGLSRGPVTLTLDMCHREMKMYVHAKACVWVFSQKTQV